jgi:hypothetical protein
MATTRRRTRTTTSKLQRSNHMYKMQCSKLVPESYYLRSALIDAGIELAACMHVLNWPASIKIVRREYFLTFTT